MKKKRHHFFCVILAFQFCNHELFSHVHLEENKLSFKSQKASL